MSSSDLNLSKPPFQGQLRSKVVRNALTDIENNFNALRAEVYASIASTASEVTSARDEFGNLVSNIHIRRVINKNDANGFDTYDHVSELGTPSMHVHVSAGEGLINGVGVDWSSATSATFTAPAASNKRIDRVVVNTDNSVSIIAGTATTGNPIPATMASTQDQIALVYLTAGTTTLQDDINIFNVLPKSDNPDYIITDALTLNQGRYDFNNLIVNASITIDCTGTAGFDNLQRENIVIKCNGLFKNTSSGDFTVTSPHSIPSNGNNGSNATDKNGAAGGVIGYTSITNMNDFSMGTSKGGSGAADDAPNNSGGGGGGGGASILFTGGAGGDGGTTSAVASGGASRAATDSIIPFMIISGENLDIGANITMNGVDGNKGTAGGAGTNVAAGGGSGGNAGGILFLLAYNDITVQSGATVSCNGGAGGEGGDSTGGTDRNAGGGGGGGGAGGLVLIRSRSYTNNGTVSASAGGAGGAGSASGGAVENVNGNAGSAGSAGSVDQQLFISPSDIRGGLLPLNAFGMDVLK